MSSTTAVTSEIGHLLMGEGNLTIQGGFDNGDQGALWAVKGGWGIGWSRDQEDGSISMSVLDADTGLPLHDDSERGECDDFEDAASALGSLLWRTREAREAAEREAAAKRAECQAGREADRAR